MNTISPASALQGGVSTKSLLMPDAPVCMMAAGKIHWLSSDGEIRMLSADSFAIAIRQEMPIVCHAPFISSKLGIEPFIAYDILELFAFVHPGAFSLPTVRGLAEYLGLFIPEGAENDPVLLLNIARHLLQDLMEMQAHDHASDPVAAAWIMAMGRKGYDAGQGWPWAEPVLHALGAPEGPERESAARAGIQIWHRLPEWSESAPEPPPAHHPVSGEEAEARLNILTAQRGQTPRTAQIDYSKAVAAGFAPMQQEDKPNTVIAEAGTGIGKTLGYLAPATVWAEKNDGAVWISTYTRNLQRQIDQELDRLYGDP
ncbi:MAG: ATP-dependent DNA helicase, partial [Pseudomonadota bacterium]